jgi:hypothetical protein
VLVREGDANADGKDGRGSGRLDAGHQLREALVLQQVRAASGQTAT